MFNLSKISPRKRESSYKKYSQAVETAPENLDSILEDQLKNTDDQKNQFNAPASPVADAELSTEDASQGLSPEESQAVIEKAAVDSYYRILGALEKLSENGASVRESLNSMPQFQKLKALVESKGDPLVLEQKLETLGITGRDSSFANVSEIAEVERSALERARKTFENLKTINEFKQIDQHRTRRQVAFNLKNYKVAQGQPIETHMTQTMQPMNMQDSLPDPEHKPMDAGSFPVTDAGDLVAKFMGRILSDDPRERKAVAEEVLSQVKGDIQEEEINSMVESLMLLKYNSDEDQAKALNIFGKMFKILPSHLKGQADSTMEAPVMAKKNPKGIIKFNLSDHVLNNQQQPVTKTAADQFGQHYLLYGPSEKRICPKLRGWGSGGGSDVVSEYICRHHCLDGLVIDDNKTICGEAIWRANSMDKFSREYVDKDGEIVGGYLNKRFEINRNVPEETKMRLKPGETRKPRPANTYGNYEARMQEMRQKEGEKRGYRPDTNTGDTFKWCTDVDQNNVEQSQSTRDSREEAMGHQTVQYTNKNQQENLTNKTAQVKTAEQWMQEAAEEMEEKGTVGDFTEWCGGKVTEECIERGLKAGGKRAKQANFARNARKAKHKKSFNLKNYKTAQGGNIAPVVNDGSPIEMFEQKNRSSKDLSMKDVAKTVGRAGKAVGKGAMELGKGFGEGIKDPKGDVAQIKNIIQNKKTVAKVENDEIKKTEVAQFPKDTGCTTCTDSGEMPAKSGFNLRQHKIAKEKGVTYKGEHFDYNPWAVCNKSTGGKNEAGEEKFERCVQHVKDQDREDDSSESKKKT